MPERHISKPILDAALEATTLLDESLIESGAPTFREAGHKVVWRPEPAGHGENFDHVLTGLRRGWMDCDDLAPWHAASLRVTGQDPDAFAEVYKSGPGRWHAVVRRGDGSIDDPSKWRGMRPGVAPGVMGVGAIFVHGAGGLVGSDVGAYSIDPRLYVRPRGDGAWESRTDMPYDFVPWQHDPPGLSPEDVAMATLHTAHLPSQAIAGATAGAARVARKCNPEDNWCCYYLMAQHNVHAHDWDYDDVADEFGSDIADAVEESVGALWDKMTVGIKIRAPKFVRKAADSASKLLRTPAAKAVAPILPGGAPALMWAHGGLSAEKALRKGGSLADIARGGFGGAGRGALTYFEHPLVKKMGGEIPVVKDMVPYAERAAQLAAQADVPKMARDQGVKAAPKAKRTKKSKSKGKSSGSSATFVRPRKVAVYL